jgi:uncharacterized protein (TIRG00374 family)
MALFKSKKGKYISYALRFAVAGAALYWAFRKVDFHEVSEKLFGLNIWVVLFALGTWLANQFIFVSRWLLLLRVQSVKIGFWAALRLHFLGIFYNNCLPSAVGGDFIRAGYVTTHTDKKVEAVLSVFVDRFVGVSSMVIMATVCYLIKKPPKIPMQEGKQGGLIDILVEYWWIWGTIVLLVLLALAGFLLNAKGRELLKKGFVLAWKHCCSLLKKVYKAMLIYWNHKIAFVLAYLLSFACQGIFIVGLWMVGRNLGMDCAGKYYFVFFPIAWMIGAIPISVGGLGVWEKVLIEFFTGIGVKQDLASALALFHRALWLFGSLPGVVIHLSGAHLPKEFSVDYTGPSS